MFAVKWGDINKRFDPNFHNPKFRALLNIVNSGLKLENFILSIDTGCNYPQINETDNTVQLLRTQNIHPVYAETVEATFVDSSLVTAKTDINDLMFVRVGVGVGDCCVITENEIGYAFSDNILRVKLHTLLPEFVAIYLSLPAGKQLLIRNSKGSGKAVISRISIESIPIPKLSTDKQLSICNAYRVAAQSRREKLRDADVLLAGMNDFVCAALKISLPTATPKLGVVVTMRQLKADKAFNVEYYHVERTNAIAAVKAVPHKRLGDCVYFMRDIVSANNDQYLGLAGVQSNTGELSGAEDDATGQAFVFRANDVLYCRLRPYLNKIWKAEYGGVCSTEFHVLRVKCNSILPEYLATVMRSTLVLNQSRHMMTGNTHPRITNDDVANLLIPVPDMPIQQKIADEMQIRRDTARALRAEAETEWVAAKAKFELELLGGTGK